MILILLPLVVLVWMMVKAEQRRSTSFYLLDQRSKEIRARIERSMNGETK